MYCRLKTGTELFPLNFICLSVSFAPFYIHTQEPLPSILNRLSVSFSCVKGAPKAMNAPPMYPPMLPSAVTAM